MNPQDLPAASDRLATTGAHAAPAECEVILSHLWDFLDGNCATEMVGRIASHMPACSACTQHLVTQGQFFASLAAVRQRLGAPAALHAIVRNTLAAEGRASGED